MSWKCLFFHDYKMIGTAVEREFQDDDSKRPHLIQTRFLFKCSIFNKIYTKTVLGNFGRNDSDDDDDNEDHHPPPVLSPDDYYESIEK